tara:strand:- start:7203 stop:8210 length:1008 start_codon:yes stop_codon:yes gene_type:complete
MIKDKFNRSFKDLRVSVTDRCNFRCSYCMPAEIYGDRYQFLSRKDLLSFEEITRLVRICVGLGSEKIRLTGGEPLVRSDIEELISLLSSINGVKDLAMTTNGYMLAEKADVLKAAGLDRLTISLDTLDEDVFKEMNGRNFSNKKIFAGIDAAERLGYKPIKINAVVKRAVNEHTILDLARYFKERGHIVRFIEFMDVGTINKWNLDQVVSAAEIFEIINSELPIEPVESNYPGEVALRYRYSDGSGEIGIIASVTKPFCGNCTRLRLSPEGTIYTCLFSNAGIDLKEPLRSGVSDEDIIRIINGVWGSREDTYSEDRAYLSVPVKDKVEMYHIGG